MNIANILEELDAEIARLHQVRTLLSGRGNLKISRLAGASTAEKGKGTARKKRTLSPEARQKIGDAQRKRWAAQKRAAK